MPRRTLLLLAVVPMLLAACARTPSAPRPASAPSGQPGQESAQQTSAAAQEAASIPPMPQDKRGSTMPKGLPFEVAVPDGTVTKAVADNRANGDGLWLYDLESTATPDAMGAWYQNAYAIRDWELVSTSREGSVADPVAVLYFRKGSGAETMLRIRKAADGCTIEGSVALGVPLDRSL